MYWIMSVKLSFSENSTILLNSFPFIAYNLIPIFSIPLEYASSTSATWEIALRKSFKVFFFSFKVFVNYSVITTISGWNVWFINENI